MIGITNAGGGKGYWRVTTVYGGTSAPANPEQFDIFINTSIPLNVGEITANVSTKPSWNADQGVWYISLIAGSYSSGSGHYFAQNRRNGHAISGFPGQAWQRINGQWWPMNAYAWFNGQWVQFSRSWDGYLYKLGNNQYTDYTGGWVGGTYNSEGTLDFTASGSPDSVIRTAKAVDLTNFNTLVFDGIMWGNNSGGAWGGNMIVCSGADGSGVVAQKNIGTTAWGQYSLDISSVKGSYYVRFHVGGNDHSIRMRNCYLQ